MIPTDSHFAIAIVIVIVRYTQLSQSNPETFGLGETHVYRLRDIVTEGGEKLVQDIMNDAGRPKVWYCRHCCWSILTLLI